MTVRDRESSVASCAEYDQIAAAMVAYAAEATQIGGSSLEPPCASTGRKAVAERAQYRESFEDLPDVLSHCPVFAVSDRYLPSSPSHLGTASRTVVRDDTGSTIVWPWEVPSGSTANPEAQGRQESRKRHHTDDLMTRALDASMADGKMGRTTTGVRAWHIFCAKERTPAFRPLDPCTPLQDKLREEHLAMQFVCALVKDRGVAPATAATYLGQVQGWHGKEAGIRLAGGLKLCRLPAMLKGLYKIMGQPARAVRRGIAPRALKTAMDIVLNPANPAHANIRAALSVALQGLLRSAEFACDPSVKWVAERHLARADLVECSTERLVLMMLPCKNMRHLSGKSCPLVIGAGGGFVDAVAEVRNMLAVDPTPVGRETVTPLFRDPSKGTPLRTNVLRELTRTLMSVVGEPQPHQFGTHSYRIGGATALFAAGADETVIRTLGRWSSDCYRLYVRACFKTTLK